MRRSLLRPAILLLAALLLPPAPAARALDSIELVPVATSIGQVPIAITHAPGDPDRLYVATQQGRILIWDGAALLPTPFLDISSIVNTSGGEQGLLGLDFHPDYASNGFLYVHYTNQPAGDSLIVRFTRSAADPDRADPASGTLVLFVDQPFANHNGGQVVFGPDGYLHLGFGDGGGGGDPNENAENLGSLLGKILRIDVDGGAPYAIPPDNPFVGVAGARAEVWAYGLRHPWRFDFDPLTGDLWIGDVGQTAVEEVNFEPAGSGGGRDYGWDRMEGSLCFEPATGCNDGTLTLPVIEYPNANAPECSVIGGTVYRGVLHPELWGRYLYADACSGRFWAAVPDGSGGFTSEEVLLSPVRPSTFGTDAAGELYVGDLRGGVYRVRPPAPRCLVVATDTSVSAGEVLTVDQLRVQNFSAFARPVELKLWLRSPGEAPFGAISLGATGSLVLPPGFDALLGPIPLLQVDGATTRGRYEFGCTLLEPATGATYAGASAAFAITD